jgi:hypothetical protein
MSAAPGFAFVTLRSLATSTLVDDERVFHNIFPQPVILLPIPSDVDQDDSPPASKETRRFKTLSDTGAAPDDPNTLARSIESYFDAAVIQLFKDPTAPGRTTIGRADENEITLPSPTVSARHGTFVLQPDGSHAYVDAGSSNGSRVMGKPVPPRRPTKLDNGTEIALGKDVRVLFLTPKGLLSLARLVRARLTP